MPNDLAHERERFRTLTVAQLRTRLSRITDLVKVSNFIIVADGYVVQLRGQGLYAENYRQLAIEARARIDYLTSLNPPSGPRASWRRWRENMLRLSNIPREERRLPDPPPRDPSGIREGINPQTFGNPMLRSTTTGLAPSGMYGPSFMMVPFTQDDMMRQAVQEPAIIKEEERPEPMVRVIRFKGRGSNEGSSGTE